MTDSTMPKTNVVMVRDNVRDLPDWPLPEGYTIRPIVIEDIGLWSDVWNDAEDGRTYSHDHFRSQFGHDQKLIAERCLLLVDPRGVVVGTTSAWFKDKPDGMGLIHWVAIRPAYQGKGLAKPLMAEAMKRLALYHDRMMLKTQAHRLPAIALYLRCGFEGAPGDNAEQQKLWAEIHSRLEAAKR